MNQRVLIGAFIVVLIIKSLSVLYLTQITHCENSPSKIGFWSISAGDTYSYIQPVENLFLTGTYYAENELGEKVYAGRMPYYGFFYLIFRMFLDPSGACDALVFLHIFFESLAIVAVSLLVFYISKSISGFYFSLLILLASLNVTYWTGFIMPESLGISFLVLFLYNYYLFVVKEKKQSLILSAVFLALLVVLKPYYIFIYVLLAVDWLFSSPSNLQQRFKITTANSILTGGILVILLSPWIIRNYNVYQKFVPTQISLYAGINYSKAELAWRGYVTSWGGNIVHWDDNSAGCYFKSQSGINCKFVLPEKAIPKGYTKNDIEKIRTDFADLLKNNDSKKDEALEHEFNELKRAIISGSPMQYHVFSRMSLIGQFLFHSGSYYLPVGRNAACHSYFFQLPVKLLQSTLYYFTLVVGFIGLAIMGRRQRFVMLCLGIVLMLLFTFPILLRLSEWRYFMYTYYLLVIGSSLVMVQLMTKFPFLNRIFMLSQPKV